MDMLQIKVQECLFLVTHSGIGWLYLHMYHFNLSLISYFSIFSPSLPPCQMISNKFWKSGQRFVTWFTLKNIFLSLNYLVNLINLKEVMCTLTIHVYYLQNLKHQKSRRDQFSESQALSNTTYSNHSKLYQHDV
jgi:hypothetical protein